MVLLQVPVGWHLCLPVIPLANGQLATNTEQALLDHSRYLKRLLVRFVCVLIGTLHAMACGLCSSVEVEILN